MSHLPMKSSQAPSDAPTAPTSSNGRNQHEQIESVPQQDDLSDAKSTPQNTIEAVNATGEMATTNSSQSSVPSSASTCGTLPQPASNPRLEALNQKKARLEATLATLKDERAALVTASKLSSDAPYPAHWTDEDKTKQALEDSHAVIKEHIALLHQYNEIKDIGQGLMGLIADGRGVRVASVMEEFGIDGKD